MNEYIDRNALFEAVRDKSITQFDWSEKVDLEEFEEVLNSIPSAEVEAKRKWIPVTERLPEDNTRILGFSKTYRRADVYVICEEKWWDDDEYWNTAEGFGITHWMPLPLPPETEKGGAE